MSKRRNRNTTGRTKNTQKLNCSQRVFSYLSYPSYIHIDTHARTHKRMPHMHTRHNGSFVEFMK